MDVVVRRLGRDDLDLVECATNVFDNPVDRVLAGRFLNDPHHHLIGAVAEGILVGFVSAVDYVHPDKPSALWINEVSVSPDWQGRGIGRRLMDATLALARSIGCVEAWVLAEEANASANALYRSACGVPAPNVMYSFVL